MAPSLKQETLSRTCSQALLKILQQPKSTYTNRKHHPQTNPRRAHPTQPAVAEWCRPRLSELQGPSLKLRLNLTSLAASGRVLASCARVICGVGLRDLGVVAWVQVFFRIFSGFFSYFFWF